MNTLRHYEMKKLIFRREMLMALMFLVVYFTVTTGVTLLQFTYTTTDGEVKGIEAVKTFRESQKKLEGPLTSERVAAVIGRYIEIHSESANLDSSGELKDAVFVEQWLPYEGLGTIIGKVFSPAGKFDPYKMSELKVGDGTRFYEQYAKTLAAKEIVGGKEGQKPFYYGYHLGWLTIIQNMWFHGIVLTLCMCISFSSIFAGEHECGMNPILRCAKNGKKPLNRAKVQSALCIATAMFVVAMGLYVFGVLFLYGSEGSQVSLQIISTFSPFQLNVAQAVGLCLLFSFIGYLGFVTMTLFLSQKIKKSLAASAGIIGFLVIPMFIPLENQAGVLNQMLYLLPSNLMNASELVKSTSTNIWLSLMLPLLWMPLLIRQVVKEAK